MKLPSTSTEFVRVPVRAKEAGEPVVMSSTDVDFAFKTATTEPTALEWVTGSWENDKGNYYARCLVGPDGDALLAEGRYNVWVRITVGDEVPVRKVGVLEIT